MLSAPQKDDVAKAGKSYEQSLVPKITTQSSAPAPRGAGRGATARPIPARGTTNPGRVIPAGRAGAPG